MIETLLEFGFFKYRDGLYYDGGWEYMFNPFKNTLYYYASFISYLIIYIFFNNELLKNRLKTYIYG